VQVTKLWPSHHRYTAYVWHTMLLTYLAKKLLLSACWPFAFSIFSCSNFCMYACVSGLISAVHRHYGITLAFHQTLKPGRFSVPKIWIFRSKNWAVIALIDHPWSGVVQYIISALSVCLSDNNFRKTWHSKFIFVQSSGQGQGHGSKYVENPYSRNVKLWLAITKLL